jgi:hypothetical protein
VQLAGISRDIRNFTGNIADATDKHFEQVAASIRERLASATWLPEAARPFKLPPPRAVVKPPPGYVERVQDWVSKHRAITAAIIAFTVTGGVLVYHKKKGYGRKRRARRASNGARREVTGTMKSEYANFVDLRLTGRSHCRPPKLADYQVDRAGS